jgi:serine/threonine protein kinase
MKVIPLSEGSFTIDHTKIFLPFDTAKDDLQERSRGSLLVEIQPFLVETKKDLILLDTGLGFSENGVLQLYNNLAVHGYSPSDITMVLMSHLHRDHAGGIAVQDSYSGLSHLSFPHADYFINKRELDFYMYFSENYLHYPVIYKDIECRACHLNDLEKKDDCMVILSELYDGTLKSIKNTLSKEQILSMIIQVVYACSVLEQLELVHGDLHTANILYKNISDDTIPIEIGEKTYPLKTYGKLWVLWDFGNMTYTGETIPIVEIKAIDTLHTDLYKLLVLVNKNYLNYLNELIDHKTIKTVKELIEYLFNRYPTLCE